MRGLIIRRRSVVGQVLRWLGEGVPKGVRGFWRGPVASSQITALGLGEVEGAVGFRPVDLAVAPEAMLPMRLVIPTEGRHELPHAVALAIRQDTPFEPEEMVAQAVEVERGAGSEAYLIHAVPKRLIGEAVRALKHRRLGRITAANGPDLAPALFPLRRLGAWLGWVPVVFIVSTGAIGAYGVLTEQELRAAALEVRTSGVLAELREVSTQLEAIEVKAAAGNRIMAAISATPPAMAMLESIRRLLSEGTEVVQVELREGDLRLALRTTDALGDMARFVQAGWTAAIEGAITADPVSGREIATLRLSLSGGTD